MSIITKQSETAAGTSMPELEIGTGSYGSLVYFVVELVSGGRENLHELENCHWAPAIALIFREGVPVRIAEVTGTSLPTQ